MKYNLEKKERKEMYKNLSFLKMLEILCSYFQLWQIISWYKQHCFWLSFFLKSLLSISAKEWVFIFWSSDSICLSNWSFTEQLLTMEHLVILAISIVFTGHIFVHSHLQFFPHTTFEKLRSQLLCLPKLRRRIKVTAIISLY